MNRITTALLIASALALPMLALPIASSAEVSVGISMNIGPPPLPDYVQPDSPGANFIWTPGYWGSGDDGYFWVPGTWMVAPVIGLLWTPGYWGWQGGAYRWSGGYWDTHVGFYGGVNYGYGYAGVGYSGGYWRGNSFYRNRAVTYSGSRVSFNGGAGGIDVRATATEEAFARGQHTPATDEQREHEHVAMSNPAQRFSQNHGRPDVAATPRAQQSGDSGAAHTAPARDAKLDNQANHGPAVNNPAPQNQARLARSRPAHNQAAHSPAAQNPVGHNSAPQRPPQAQRGQPHARQPEARSPSPQKEEEHRHPPY